MGFFKAIGEAIRKSYFPTNEEIKKQNKRLELLAKQSSLKAKINKNRESMRPKNEHERTEPVL